MTHALVVVDTNVVVSGMLSADVDSPPARILDAMLEGRFPFVLSVELLAEYRTVLLRPRVAARHGLAADEVDAVLASLAANAVVRAPVKAPEAAPDPGDALLWDLLAATPGAALVTGDNALLDHPPGFATVMTPAALVASLGA